MSFTDFDFSLPVIMSSIGPQPTPPSTLLAQLIAAVSAQNPGYTANLPATLIEDVSSTDVGAMIVCDQARVDSINAISPYGANEYLLLQLGQIYIGDGTMPGIPTNVSVYVIFTAVDSNNNPLSGVAINPGFQVSDGTYQYTVQDGGVTGSDGQTEQLYCLATVAGQWAVPTGSVTQIVTASPPNVTLSVTNPVTGVSNAISETEEQFRARVLMAGQAIATGTQNLLKTLLLLVPGVQPNLVSVQQQSGGGWEIICGGGDPYLTAGAIFASGIDISTLVGSTLNVTGITQADPGVVTVDKNHGYSDGQQVTLNDVLGMTQVNGNTYVATVLSEKTFSIGTDTSGYSAYESGGVATPNFRNQLVSILDYPDLYDIVFVNPPEQIVTVDVTYDTISDNFVSQAAVAQLASAALASYISSIGGPGAPISLLMLQNQFLAAVDSILLPTLVSSLTFEVFINGIETGAEGDLVYGDPESYFSAVSSGINVIYGG